MKAKDKIVYSINIEDIQTVAEEEIGRALNEKELKLIENEIGEHISWYDTIADLIQEKVKSKLPS